MNEQNEREPAIFAVTKAYRRFTEVCDACRRFRSVGLGYGPPGTGKPSLLDITRSGSR
jgi:DNA transposition AAA+ family ATPase